MTNLDQVVAPHEAGHQANRNTYAPYFLRHLGLVTFSLLLVVALSSDARAQTLCEYEIVESRQAQGSDCTPPGGTARPKLHFFKSHYACDGTYLGTAENPCFYSSADCTVSIPGLELNCPTTSTCAQPTCSACDPSSTESCDGSDNDCDGLNDEGCDPVCGDQDPYPTNYATGLSHSLEREDFTLPGFDQIPFQLTHRWWSTYAEPDAWSGTAPPPVAAHHRISATFMGQGWRHSLEQRVFSFRAQGSSPAQFTWMTDAESIEFQLDASQPTAGDPRTYTRFIAKHDAPYELRLYGGQETTTGIRIINKDTYVTHEFDFTAALGTVSKVAYLTRIVHYPGSTSYAAAVPTDRYWIQIDRNSDGSANIVRDTFGARTLRFTYQAMDLSLGRRTRVASVKVCGATATACPANAPTMSLSYYGTSEVNLPGSGNRRGGTNLLESITYPDGGYERYLYTATDAGWRLTNVLQPRRFGITKPANGAIPLALEEIIVEQMDYTPGGWVRQSSGPDGAYGYEYDDSTTPPTTVQYDLSVPSQGTCPSSCATGYRCWTATQECRRVTIIDIFQDTAHSGKQRSYCTDCGAYSNLGREYFAADATRVKVSTDRGGMKTTYEYWSTADHRRGRIKRMVVNDTDDDASTVPTSPLAYAIDYDYGIPGVAHTDTVERSSLLPTALHPKTRTTIGYDAMGRVISRTVGGNSVIIGAGAAVSTEWRDEVTTTVYDNFGRPLSVDGPLPNTSSGSDLTTFTYNSTGLLESTTRYVTLTQTLTTWHYNYDLYGNATLTTTPDTVSTTYAFDARGRMTSNRIGADTTGQDRLYNPNGSLLMSSDADGACESYVYDTGGNLALRWHGSKTSPYCGTTVPTVASGETETYAYSFGRLTQISRTDASGLQYQVSYEYDERKLAAAVVNNSGAFGSARKRFRYDINNILNVEKLENCDSDPTNCTETLFDVDQLGRHRVEERRISGSGYAQAIYEYGSPLNSLPTVVKTQAGGGATATTTSFTYDDFARIVSHASPDSGITRAEFDIAGRMIKRRSLPATGTIGQTTTAYTYDGVGRKKTVDHQTETSNSCAGIAAGTPLSDEEYWYDTCPPSKPAGFTCTYSAGRMTMARVHRHCTGSSSQPVYKRGTWFKYDSHGRLATETQAISQGPGGFCSATTCPTEGTWTPYGSTSYTYTIEGRLMSVSSPISTNYGQTYVYATTSGSTSTGVGRLNQVNYTNGTSAIANIEYKPFGPYTKYSTPASTTNPIWLNRRASAS